MQPAEPPPIVVDANAGADAGAQPTSPAPPPAPSAEMPTLPPGPPPSAPVASPPPSVSPSSPPPSIPPAPAPPSTAPIASVPPSDSLLFEKPEAEMPALELGAGAFFLAGGAAGSYAGVTPFLVDEVARGVFLRPSLAIGGSLATEVSSIIVYGRLDTCARLPGRYANRNGIQLDLCAGPDVGVSFVSAGKLPNDPPSDKTLPYVNLGPSLDLHGEVGNVAVLLRGVFGINVARERFVDATGAQFESSPIAWRLELDFSWDPHR